MKCKACGAELSENSKFCGMCGEPNTAAFPDPTKLEEYDADKILNDIYDKQKQKQDNISDSSAENSETAAGENVWTHSSPASSTDSDAACNSQDKSTSAPEASAKNAQSSPIEQSPAADGVQESAGQGGFGENGSYGYNTYGNNQSSAYSSTQSQGISQGGSASNGASNYSPKPSSVQKEKKVMPFGVGVFCIIAVFVLSAFCGYLIELCLGSGINPLNPAKQQSRIQLENNAFYGEYNG